MGRSGSRRVSAPAPTTSSGPGGAELQVRTLPRAARQQAGQAWRAAEVAAGGDAPPFCGWEWTEQWLEQYGDAVPHEFVIAERGGAVVAAALLTRSRAARGPVVRRRLHLGTAGEPAGEGVFVEYNGLCAPAAERAAVAHAVLGHVHRQRAWDELCLDGFDPEHAAPFRIAEPHFEVVERISPVLDLDPAVDDLVALLDSKSTRSTVRRSLRGIAPYTVEWAASPERAHLVLDDLERLHQERWQARGEAGAFASARFRAFHRGLVQRWLPQGRAVVFAVRRDDVTIAALYGFVVGDGLQFYQGGFLVAEHNKVRTGYAAHLLLAQAARERGIRHYEYLVGDHRYKSELSTAQRSLVWATLRRRRPRAMAIGAALRIRRAWHERRANRDQGEE